MNTSNPVLSNNVFSQFGYGSRTDSMTMQGTVIKTFILLLCAMLTAGYTWIKFFQSGANPESVSTLMWVGVFGGLALALVTSFKMEWAPVTSIFYALFEGLFIGALSAMLEVQFRGIAIQAAGLTFGVLFTMLAVYQAGWIQVTDKFRFGVVAATGGIALFYLISMALGFFGVNIPYVFGNGLIGIGFSLFVVGLAALNLVLDFDFIERGVRANVPKYMEWYGAFALMVTLVWLYVEVLRLLSKLRSKD
jgi:uncharacterized YccA/Bax inhibitor family protein